LILIFGLSIWAIMSSAVAASNLETFGRMELGARTTAASLFEVLESFSPASLDANFGESVADAIALLGGSGDGLRGHTVAAVSVSSANGVRVIRLTLSSATKKAPLVVEKAINSYSEETVDDVVE
jgi:hypothetical protein